MDSCDFQDNSSGGGAGACYLCASESSTMLCEISHSHFEGNTTNGSGGACNLCASESSTLAGKISHSQFEKNTCNERGAAILSTAWRQSINQMLYEDCDFIENEVLWPGFVVTVMGGTLFSNGDQDFSQIKNCRFISNTISGYGGALVTGSAHARSSKVLVEDCLFENNKSILDGGAWFMGRSALLQDSAVNCVFRNNETSHDGGGIAIEFYEGQDSPGIMYCDFINNQAENGGAINSVSYRDPQNPILLEIGYCRFFQNKTLEHGGAIGSISGRESQMEVYIHNSIFGAKDSASFDTSGLTLHGTPRLVDNQIDMGAYEYEFPTAIHRGQGDEKLLKVWPNPASDVIWCELPELSVQEIQITIFDLKGRMIQPQADRLVDQQVLQVSLKGMIPGLYLIQVRTKEGLYKEKITVY